jgi:hypothetical protein
MTYRDGISWLAKEPSLAGKDVSVLWLGSSFANESRDDFGQLLRGISSARAAQNSSPASRIAKLQLLVSADGTKDPVTVSHAYDSRDGLSRAFVLNVLHNANRSLGRRVFDTDKWCFDGVWDAEEGQFQTCIRALEGQAVKVAGEEVVIRKGEKIKVITSRKLGPDDIETWLAGTGFTVNSSWKHPRFDYGELSLLTCPRPADRITFAYLAEMANFYKLFINSVCSKEKLTSSNLVGNGLPAGKRARASCSIVLSASARSPIGPARATWIIMVWHVPDRE